MANILGVLGYRTELDNSGIERGLSELEGEVQATMASIDRQRAVVSVSAELRDFDTKIADAQAKIKRMEAQAIEVPAMLKDEQFNAEMAKLRAEVKRASADRLEIRVRLQGAAQAAAEMKALEATQNRLANAEESSRIRTARNAAEVANLRKRYAELYTARKRADDVDFGRTSARERLEIARLDGELRSTGERIRALGGDLEGAAVDLEKDRTLWSRWGQTLSKTRISMGPVSTSLKGLGIILGTMGPILVNLVGTAGALVGVVGTGLAGAAAVGAGAIGGFGLAVLGLLPSLKALFAEAKTAPEIVGPLQKMRDSLTGGIRRSFFADAHAGIATLEADFPTFQRGAEGAFKAASTGFQSWMHGLRSPEARAIIGDLLGNLAKGLPAVMTGLGSVGTTLARVAQSGSKFLPSLNQGFAQWAQNLERSVGSGNALDQRIGRLVGHMRDLGHFTQASGSLLTTFFSSGANSGDDLLKTFTATENRWTSWMRSVEGQNSLHSFFHNAVQNSSQFFSALAPLLAVFVKLSNAFTPLSTGALKFATALGDVVHTVASFGLGSALLKTFGAVLAGVFVVNRITHWGEAISGAFATVGGLLGLDTAATEANSIAQAENAAARESVTAAAGIEAAAVETSSAAMAEGSLVAETGLLGAGGGAGLLAAALSPVGIAVGVVTVGLIGMTLWAGKADTVSEHYRKTLTAVHDSAVDTAAAQRQVTNSQKDAEATTKQLNKLTQQGKGSTAEYGKTLLQQRHQVEQSRQGEAKYSQQVQRQINNIRDLKTQVNTYHQAQESANNANKAGVVISRGSIGALAAQESELRGLSGVTAQYHLAQLNLQRSMKGLGPIAQEQAGLFQSLRQTFGKKITTQISVAGSAGQVNQIAHLAAQLRSFASQKAIAHILLDDKGASGKIQELLALLARTDKPHHTKVTASTNKSQVDAYLDAAARADKPHTTHIRADTGQALSAVQQMQAAVDALHGKTITNYVNNVIRRGASSGAYTGGIMAGFANGGTVDSMMEAAWARASRASGLVPNAGAKVNSPRYVVGEEPGRTEFIITDNPAYRDSNLQYLAMAAGALGQALIPGFKKGGSPTKQAKKQAGKARAGLGGVPEKTPGNVADQWDIWSQSQQDWSDEYDLDRRSYDSGIGGGGIWGGFALPDLLYDLAQEKDAYQHLRDLLPQVQGLKKLPDVTIPSGKVKPNVKKQLTALKGRVDAYNSSLDTAQGDVGQYTDTQLRHLMAALDLEMLEIQQASSSNTILGTETSNQIRYDLYKQFASNVLPAGSGSGVPTGGLGTQSSFPALPSLNSAATAAAASVAPASAAPAAAGASGEGGIFIEQTFAAPPPDAHTWARNVTFEIAAAGA